MTEILDSLLDHPPHPIWKGHTPHRKPAHTTPTASGDQQRKIVTFLKAKRPHFPHKNFILKTSKAMPTGTLYLSEPLEAKTFLCQLECFPHGGFYEGTFYARIGVSVDGNNGSADGFGKFSDAVLQIPVSFSSKFHCFLRGAGQDVMMNQLSPPKRCRLLDELFVYRPPTWVSKTFSDFALSETKAKCLPPFSEELKPRLRHQLAKNPDNWYHQKWQESLFEYLSRNLDATESKTFPFCRLPLDLQRYMLRFMLVSEEPITNLHLNNTFDTNGDVDETEVLWNGRVDKVVTLGTGNTVTISRAEDSCGQVKTTLRYSWAYWLRPNLLATNREMWTTGFTMLYRQNTYKFTYLLPSISTSRGPDFGSAYCLRLSA